ncbi:MAG: hypothetical protein BM556_07975 [Bacteriovorax sp. MedPE-SWde]|nr:MAG: hypothetical protein BM556_07975 [Bacteriovorax sp. MedPE-SWde]
MAESKVSKLTISEEDVTRFKRLDQFLAHYLVDQSRSFLKELFLKGHVTAPIKIEIKRLPPVGTEVTVVIPPPREADAQPENIPLEIIYEDEHLVFVNKPAGMVTHPAPGNYTGTLVNAILHHCPDLKGVGDQKRPGIVHRLDKGTSGIMVVAKEQKCHEGLVKLFSTHDIDRVYEALVMGTRIDASGRLESTIARHPQNRLKMAANVKGGKNAITYFKALEFYDKFSRMEMKLETGRTHQIRVHLSQLLKRPILCDPLYGNPKEHLNRLGGEYKSLIKDYEHPFLHAKILGLIHPITKEKLFFEVDPPQLFQDVISLAKGE